MNLSLLAVRLGKWARTNNLASQGQLSRGQLRTPLAQALFGLCGPRLEAGVCQQQSQQIQSLRSRWTPGRCWGSPTTVRRPAQRYAQSLAQAWVAAPEPAEAAAEAEAAAQIRVADAHVASQFWGSSLQAAAMKAATEETATEKAAAEMASTEKSVELSRRQP